VGGGGEREERKRERGEREEKEGEVHLLHASYMMGRMGSVAEMRQRSLDNKTLINICGVVTPRTWLRR
jgi:hypothetical protein